MDQEKELPKTAAAICWIITIITIATLIIGLLTKNPLWLIAGIVPAALYEAWRTEGCYTKAASVGIAILVILEILAIKAVIKLNLANILGTESVYFSGYFLPLGEITFVFPMLAVILSLVLLWRTYGKYTKWLAILLIVSSAALLYLVSKETLGELLRSGIYFY